MQANSYPSWFYKLPAKYRPNTPAELGSRVYAKIALGFYCLAFTALIWEWLTIGVFPDKEKITDYMFGSASMLGEGGPHYASAETYAHAMLLGAASGLPFIILFALAIRKNNKFYRLLAWSASLLSIAWNLFVAE